MTSYPDGEPMLDSLPPEHDGDQAERVSDGHLSDAISAMYADLHDPGAPSLEPVEPVERPSPIESHDVESDSMRLDALSRAIALYPDAPANYVFRAELLAEAGYVQPAVENFRQALTLAQQQAETADWGYIHRALMDRAIEGLRRLTGKA